ncbi:hypothetical protein MHM93_17340 [Pseudoalteromonas sp. MM17-2]|uniref:SMODS domain-containing nucleotidyltransferase n=1 Tax=Pseudoalteromonas sp. MM17-2 TaxID=2917753 RepID=UPI001EF48C34|nr:hypothetical protein [Pseudoalteromonas sp. MM17-2]MCG7545948.1 hypothetical protein [Pseudoalteromonas sp. MM17-2]
MKLIKYFNEFMSTEVCLNQSRINALEQRVSTITGVIKQSVSFKTAYINAIPQGSYAQKTIIKPTKKKAVFDADVVVYLKPIKGWEPRDYIQALYELFQASNQYSGKVSRQTRCLKLNYAGEFHIDIVPCVRKPLIIGHQNYVCNRQTNEFESCSSEEFSDWVAGKNSVTKNNNLIKSIRLAKYLRDHKQTFSAKSILLTTLLATRISLWDEVFGRDKYKDLPTSFKSLFNKLNQWLEQRDSMPIVTNPVDEEESFNRHWNEQKFQNFKFQIKTYNDWINDAYSEGDMERSIEKWRKIFGENFAKSYPINRLTSCVKRSSGKGARQKREGSCRC